VIALLRPYDELSTGIPDAPLRGVYKLGFNLVCVFLLACGSASPPSTISQSSGTEEVAEAEAIPETIAVEPVPEAVPVESAYDSDPCEGTDLDLGSLAQQSLCNLNKTAAPLPKGLVARLSTESLSVFAGVESEIRLVLKNTTSAPMAVEFDASCRFLNIIELAIYPKSKSMRIDRVSMNCDVEAKGDCQGHVVGVKIAAGGEAFFRVAIPARVALLADENCEEFPSRRLSPGPYTMMLRTAFAEKPFVATMNVRKLARLSRGKCGRYAKKVAEVAEPDASLRAGVATALAAQCARKQPSKEFSDCQLAAKTTEALQACGVSK
jgi:hypothetical protein